LPTFLQKADEAIRPSAEVTDAERTGQGSGMQQNSTNP
jgi:hypothetical protein